MTSVRGSKKSKAKSLRNIIDKRKSQIQAPEQKTEEMDFSSTTFNDVASMDKENVKSALAFFKEELLAGIRSGMDEELQKVDSSTKERLDASGIVKELYEGIKQGINDELKSYIDATTTSLKDTMTSLVDKMQDAVDSISAPGPSVNNPTEPNNQQQNTPLPLPSSDKKDMGGLQTQAQEKIAQQFLGREQLQGPKTEGIGRVRNYFTRLAHGMIGKPEAAEEKIAQRESLAFTVQTERKLNPERFKGMSNRQATKLVEKEQLKQAEVKKKLSENEAEVSKLRRAGYSEEDVEKLGYNQKRAELLQDAVRSDPSKLGKEFDAKTSIGSDVKPAMDVPKVETKSTASATPPTDAPLPKSDDKTTIAPPPSSEEDKNEATIDKEKADKVQEDQAIILTEIRDILKQQNKPGLDKTALSNPQGSGDSSPSVPNIEIDIDAPDKKTKGAKNKGPKPSKGMGIVKNIAKGAAVLGAADAVIGGVGDIMDGKKIESAGDIVPEGWDKLNPAAWAMNAGRYVGDKANAGIEAVAGQGLGGWIYDKINGNPSDKLLGSSVTPPTTGNRLISKATADNVEAKQPIVVNAPPATVINQGGGDQKVIMPPFINNMHNNEPSISRYIRSIY